MPPLLFTAASSTSGKTMIVAGLAARLHDEGRSVGYVRLPGESAEHDRGVLGEAVGATVAPDTLDVEEACRGLGGANLVFIEGDLDAAQTAAARTGAKVVVVLRGAVDAVDGQLNRAKAMFGNNLVAAVVNGASIARLGHLRREATDACSAAGITLVGVVPQTRSLLGMSVNELRARLAPVSVLGNADRDAIVDSLMIGTMGLDNALNYFGRIRNKAAIISVNRPDLMIAALQTHTLCIIATNENAVITGSQPVNPIVVSRAREMDIPILLAGRSTLQTVQEIETIFATSDFSGVGKVAIARSLVDEHLDLQALSRAIAP